MYAVADRGGAGLFIAEILHRGPKKMSNHIADVVSMSGENIELLRKPLAPNRQVAVKLTN